MPASSAEGVRLPRRPSSRSSAERPPPELSLARAQWCAHLVGAGAGEGANEGAGAGAGAGEGGRCAVVRSRGQSSQSSLLAGGDELEGEAALEGTLGRPQPALSRRVTTYGTRECPCNRLSWDRRQR